MIGYLKGIVTHLFREHCFIDVHGVGYRVFVPASTMEKLTIGKETTVFTYMNVREDAILLYGFATQDEYDLFMLLISVNGVGPKVALGVLSAVNPDGFRLAVHQKNIKVLTKMPGIGKKTAERIVLELQDKIGPVDDGAVADIVVPSTAASKGMMSEAVDALVGLGYSEQEILPVVEEKAGICQTVEQLIKEVLKALGSRR